jgi:hypothetical protein
MIREAFLTLAALALLPSVAFAQQQPPPPGGQPPVNIFASLTPDQEACAVEAVGADVLSELASFTRAPSPDEFAALQACGIGRPAGGPPPAGGPTPNTPNPGGPPPAAPGGGGVLRDQVYVTTSTDGLTWTPGVLLNARGSVPNVHRLSNGTIMAYWVDTTDLAGGPGKESIGMARSADGRTWEQLGRAVIDGLNGAVPVDPSAIQLADGRIRLYYYDIATDRGLHQIGSAISDDGLNFVVEPGIRFERLQIWDPDVVILPDGGFRMYLNNMGNVLSAISADGLTFIEEPGVRVEVQGSVPGALRLPDGSTRLYACTSGVSVWRSADGFTFQPEAQGVVRATNRAILCDPSVAPTASGYVMVYKLQPQE